MNIKIIPIILIMLQVPFAVKQIFNGNISVGDKNLFINCAEFDAGVYNIFFTTDEVQYSKKLCIKK
jgi:hypothetical protein